MTGRAAALLLAARGLLLDFDGPVCRVFAGLPAADVAERLRAVLTTAGHPAPATSDPLAVLAAAGRLGPDVARGVDDHLVAAELEAVALAEPTPDADALLADCRRRGRPVAVVSNNSADAVAAHLDRVGATGLVTAVHGRPYGRPERMKPDPHLVREAVADLDLPVHDLVLIGDSVTDVQVGLACGVPVIGFAHRPGKAAALTAAGATAVVSRLRDLLVP